MLQFCKIHFKITSPIHYYISEVVSYFEFFPTKISSDTYTQLHAINS
jgi:hypothetical protein